MDAKCKFCTWIATPFFSWKVFEILKVMKWRYTRKGKWWGVQRNTNSLFWWFIAHGQRWIFYEILIQMAKVQYFKTQFIFSKQAMQIITSWWLKMWKINVINWWSCTTNEHSSVFVTKNQVFWSYTTQNWLLFSCKYIITNVKFNWAQFIYKTLIDELSF